MTNNFFKNKIVIITGGTNSLGKAIASELVTQKADVVIIGNKKDVLLKTVKEIESLKRKNGRILSVFGDISTKEGCDILFRDLRKVVNNFDVLINNDQFFNVGKLEDEKLEDIAKALNTNVTGTILVTKLAIPILKANKKPGIINICGFAGQVALPYFSVISASKYAINGFTESLQREYAGEQLRIMGVYPAGIKSEETENIMPKMEKLGFTFDDPKEIAKKIIEAYNEQRTELVFGKKERSLIFWNKISKKNVDNKVKKIKSKLLNAVVEF